MSAESVISNIWKAGLGQYVFLPTQARRPDRWLEGDPWVKTTLTRLEQPWGQDVYFTPLTFHKNRRTNENAAPGQVLYADLDASHPEHLPVHPSIAWQTSEGMYQAVWFTSEVMLPGYQGLLNKRLTYACNADRGGWMASKVLRVPESLNFKRAYDDEHGMAVPRGRILWETDYAYSIDQLESLLPMVRQSGEGLHKEVPPVDKQALRRNWARLSLHMRSWLTVYQPDDRSLHIMKVLHGLREEGVDAADAFSLIEPQPWNKFAGRPDDLWKQVRGVYEAD